MADGVAELVFEDVEVFRGGFPDKVERLSELIAQPEYLSDLIERLEGLAEAYEEDHGIMRFQLYNPLRILAQFQKFAKEAVPYLARDGFAWEKHPVFITEDEIDAFWRIGNAGAAAVRWTRFLAGRRRIFGRAAGYLCVFYPG